MKDTPTSIIGFNHIGLSVKNLDKMVSFYQAATDYEVVKRYTVQENATADRLYGLDSVIFTKVILKGPNMLLELTDFDHTDETAIKKMLPQGPGMTHTCYQSHEERPRSMLCWNCC